MPLKMVKMYLVYVLKIQVSITSYDNLLCKSLVSHCNPYCAGGFIFLYLVNNLVLSEGIKHVTNMLKL